MYSRTWIFTISHVRQRPQLFFLANIRLSTSTSVFLFPFYFLEEFSFFSRKMKRKRENGALLLCLLLLLDLLDENDEFGKAEARGSSPANGIGVRSVVGAGLEIGVGWSIR